MTWYDTFDDSFFLTLSGALFGFGAVCLRAILKSRCVRVECYGLRCERDVDGVDDFDIGAPGTESENV